MVHLGENSCITQLNQDLRYLTLYNNSDKLPIVSYYKINLGHVLTIMSLGSPIWSESPP